MVGTARRWQAALMDGVVLGWLGGARSEAYAQSLVWLGALDGRASEARGVSADGTVVVGIHYNQNDNPRAFRWTPTRGLEDLNRAFWQLVGNSVLEYAYAVSPDGRYIVGQGRDAGSGQYLAYLLDTWRTGDTNGDGCIDDADLLAVLFAFGGAGTGNTRHEDIDKDGIVDDADLLAVLFAFGQGCE